MSSDEWRQEVVWGGRTLPSSLVAGFRRDVACNVSKTKNRIAPRNVVLTQNAKSRLRPLGGLRPALRPPSGINAGIVKRRQCWVLPLPLLLLRRCRQRLYIFLSTIALTCYFKSCQAASMQGSPSGINTGFSFPPPASGHLPPASGGRNFLRQAAWLLGFVETLPATSQKRKAVQNYSAQCRSYPKCKKQAAPARRAEARPTPTKRRKCWAHQVETFSFPRLRGKMPAGRKGG